MSDDDDLTFEKAILRAALGEPHSIETGSQYDRLWYRWWLGPEFWIGVGHSSKPRDDGTRWEFACPKAEIKIKSTTFQPIRLFVESQECMEIWNSRPFIKREDI